MPLTERIVALQELNHLTFETTQIREIILKSYV